MTPMDDKPTELTREDIDVFVSKLLGGDFAIKQVSCFKCGCEHFPNYGSHLIECDECFFAQFPKDQVRAFCRSFFE